MFTWGNNIFENIAKSSTAAPNGPPPLTNVPSLGAPSTPSQAYVQAQHTVPIADDILSARTTLRKKRNRKDDFKIFVDTDAASGLHSPKKLRPDGRKPLSARMDSANCTPSPSPRVPTTPFPLSEDDPLWLDRENFDTHGLPTPPPTPARPGSASPTLDGTAPPPPELPVNRFVRVVRPTRTTSPPPLSLPSNMILYELLELQDWNASSADILAAYRAVVMRAHPDKVPEQEREYATEHMQMINGAKEVLLDAERRRKYHHDGLLPWSA